MGIEKVRLLLKATDPNVCLLIALPNEEMYRMKSLSFVSQELGVRLVEGLQLLALSRGPAA